jgi:hypothetical protein
MESMVIKYEIPMRSIYWRIVATIALCFAILQINDIYFVAAFFYGFGQGAFASFVGWLLWRSLPCTKTLVINKEDNDG